ncbi:MULTISPECIES: AAA family ATPase [unclassified Paenibacillus]|uniref:AAA family ATPase n=1 Tax=unclassified Paenibacillus TaxID=185978 RepID=UPI001FD74D48|nr:MULTISPECIES: AAA family ATPase [unclassified Paenibacillus]
MLLVLLDDDTYFADMLSTYIRSSEYAERFSLRVFTTTEEGFRFMEETRERFIMMVHESWMPLPDTAYRIRTGCTVLISDSIKAGGLLEYPVLFKFQPLNRLLSEIAVHYNEYCENEPLRGGRGARTLAVYSSVGGSGKTVTAIHLARQLIMQGEKVLCLSLERLPSKAWFVEESGEESEAFSRMLYYAKTNPDVLSAKIEQLKRTHEDLKFDYVPPSTHLQEMAEMESTDLQSIVQGATTSGLFDWVIMDLDSYPSPVTLKALNAADHVLWLVLDDCIHLQKTVQLVQSWREGEAGRERFPLDNVTFLLNKSTGHTVNDFSRYGITLRGELPYVPEWKSVAHVEQLVSAGFAASVVQELLAQERSC